MMMVSFASEVELRTHQFHLRRDIHPLFHVVKGEIESESSVCMQRAQKNEIQMMANLPPYIDLHHSRNRSFIQLSTCLVLSKSKLAETSPTHIEVYCLHDRVVYIDVETDYSTPGILPVLKRFFCIRGYPRSLWSDRES